MRGSVGLESLIPFRPGRGSTKEVDRSPRRGRALAELKGEHEAEQCSRAGPERPQTPRARHGARAHGHPAHGGSARGRAL